jgi:alpha-beta hydrolase superfamily lysophospholipase
VTAAAEAYAPPPESGTGELRGGDGVRLHYRAWPAPGARAALLLCHGLGEHGGRYARFAAELVGRGISVYALDLRGHGRSGGPRAYADRFGRLVDDFERFRRRVAALEEGTPLLVMGHSFGGLVVIRWLQAHGPGGVRAAVLSAPLLGVAVQAPRWKVAASGVLSRLIPALPLSSEIRPEELSSDPAYVSSYREDPLVHTRITPRLYTEFMAAIAAADGERDRLRLPLLFLAPGADTIVREDAVLAFARSLAGDVAIREYPGFRHESLNDVGRERVVADVAGWIEEKLAAA